MKILEYEVTDESLGRDRAERAIWRVVFRLMLFGPDRIDEFVRAELTNIKYAITNARERLPQIEGVCDMDIGA